MMLRCDRAMLDIDKGILFCDNGGPCGKRLHYGDCPLMSQKENEKSFRIGQRVRIIGPTAADTNIHTGKYFVIEEAKGVQWKNGPFQYCVGYSKHGSIHAWPASSLELAEPEYVTDEPPTAHRLAALQYQCQKNDSKIDELGSRAVGRFEEIEKRLQALEGKANNEVATDISDEPPELHVGNYVEVVGQPLVMFGLPVGTIDRVSHSLPPFGWIALEGSGLWYPRRSLRKLSDDEIIAKIGRERKA